MPTASYWWHPGLGTVKELHVTENGKCVHMALGWKEIGKRAYDIAKKVQDELEK